MEVGLYRNGKRRRISNADYRRRKKRKELEKDFCEVGETRLKPKRGERI